MIPYFPFGPRTGFSPASVQCELTIRSLVLRLRKGSHSFQEGLLITEKDIYKGVVDG